MAMESLRKWLGVELIEVSLWEKLLAAVGGGLSIFSLFLLTQWSIPSGDFAVVVASMGASAVLLFAAPHGPLSQPWPVLAGHLLSATIGVAYAKWIPHPTLSAACAVGLAIGAMHQLKCIHPPGGATAFTAVMGGEAIRSLGWWFILCPVLSNALVMVLMAILLNSAFRWRRYPAAFQQSSQVVSQRKLEQRPSHAEVVAALRSLDSFVDITEEDLLRLNEILSKKSSEPKEDQRRQNGA